MSAGDVLPAQCEVIEVQVGELRQLFNEIDPAPFHERDLDPKAVEFIVGWSQEVPRDTVLALDVIVARGPGRGDEAALLRQAIHVYFNGRAVAARRRLRELLRRGRISLVIGLVFLASSIVAGDVLAARVAGSPLVLVLSESLLIGGWVAMWRPLEIFLYDWWPIRAEARLLDRLAAMPVRLTYAAGAPADAWRSDWPSPRSEPTLRTPSVAPTG
jgi:hypothetical protein